ncbi:glycerol kinase, partial [Bacillus tropicus]|nr:glycerol kinase [Bacillus tropicus]
DVPVDGTVDNETTVLGAAYISGLGVGYWKNQDEIKDEWHMDKGFEPTMEAKTREDLYAGWKKAIEATKAFK